MKDERRYRKEEEEANREQLNNCTYSITFTDIEALSAYSKAYYEALND